MLVYDKHPYKVKEMQGFLGLYVQRDLDCRSCDAIEMVLLSITPFSHAARDEWEMNLEFFTQGIGLGAGLEISGSF